MADDLGQLWAELMMQNNVSPQLKQIIEDLKLADGSIRKTREELERFSDVKLTDGMTDVEKNWRNMRGAISDVQREINKVTGKMSEMNSLGLGDTVQYNKYKDILLRLIGLKKELTDSSSRSTILGSEDVSRFKSEFQLASKEISNTDAQSKRLVETQKQNIGAVEKMVQQYGKMAQELSAVRQQGLDNGMTTFGTQLVQNTITRIQAASQALQNLLNNPSSVTSNMVQNATRQFEHLEQLAKRNAERMRDYLSAKTLRTDSETALISMERRLESIKNKLRSIKNDRRISVDTSGLESVQVRLEQFIEKYRTALNSGGLNRTQATNLAREFRQISEDAGLASTKLDGLTASQRRAATAAAKSASAYDPIIQKMQQLQSATTRTGRIWDQFKTQIAFTAFSVYGIEHFLKSVITVGGEFERQRVALQNMLGDMREASEIFGQLKNLALQSPFTFRQLSTYTKQLAAFSIPYEELYDTNRRLSDMSAGLGVDMSRLILAYGQVRAATVLRGQELRQFTEAGVPMVEKLADYFTKLNGQLVTTKDIFAMISKKQVPFEAVRTVIQEMTDEGGMFYNMQAKIADTLSGRWGNLKDAWEIMLGTLADSESIMGKSLKWLVELLTSVIRHLTTVAGIIGGMGIAKVMKGLATVTFAGIGSTATGSIDKYFLKAKQIQAIEYQRVAMTRSLEKHERDILLTKNKITEADRLAMLRAGQLNKYQTALLVRSGQLNQATAVRLGLEAGITKEEMKQLGKMSDLKLRMKSIWSNIAGGVNWASLGITAGIMAIGAIAGAWIDYEHKLKEARKNIAEQATETRNSLTEFFSKDQFSESLGTEEAKRFIEKYEDELKKLAPNFLEIKSRIVGEHGESPQEQAQEYRDKLQEYLDQSGDAEAIARIAFDDNNRGFGRDTVVEKANKYYEEMRNLRDKALRLDPVKLKAMVDSMDGLNKSTKDQINLLIDQGKKLEAIKRISDETSKPDVSRSVKYPDMDFYKSYINLANPLLFGSATQTEYKDAADEYFKKLKQDIVNSYKASFDDDGNWIGETKLKDQIIKGFRDALSEAGADKEAMNGLMMGFENAVFGEFNTLGIEKASSKAVEVLVNSFVSKNRDLVKKFQENGGVMTDEIKNELDNLAIGIGMTDLEFMKHVNYLVNAPGHNEIMKYLRVVLNMDDDEQEWQKELIRRYGNNEQYKAVIKASPDIPTAIEACQKLFNEAREKLASMGNLMLGVGVKLNVNNPSPLKEEGSWWESLLPWQKQAVEEVNKQTAIVQQGLANNLTPKKLKGEKSKKGGGRKEDKELQSWQRHVELYKKFLDQYRELTKMFGEKEALDRLRKSSAYTWIMEFAKGRNLSVTDIDAMNAALSGSLDVNKGDKQKRKDAIAKRQADLEAEGYKREGEELKRLNDTLNEHLKILNDQYDAYQKIYRITGDKQGAMLLAFGDKVSNQRYIDELTDQLEKALKKEGSKLSIDQALDLTKEQVNDTFGEESVAANLINKLKEERNKLEKEYIDILANALTADMSLEDKRAEAVRKHNEQMEKLIELRKKDQALADAGIEAENNRHRREIAGYDQQIFERNTSLSGALNNINVLSKGYLRALLVGLRDNMSKLANDNTPEGLQMREKLAEQIMKVTDALNDLNDNVSNLDDDFYTSGDGTRHITGITATRYSLQQDQEIDQAMENLIRNAEKFRELTKQLGKINTLVKDLENVLKPVLDLFESIGYEGSSLSKAISMASSALSSATNVANSLGSLSQTAAAAGKTGLANGLSKAAPYAAVAAVGLSVVSQMFQWQAEATQREIERSQQRQKEMENLSSNLERVLDRTLGGIYTMRSSDAQSDKFRYILDVFKVYQEKGNDGLAKLVGAKGNLWNLWTYSQSDIKRELEMISTYTKETRDAIQKALDTDSYYDAGRASLFAQRDELQRQYDIENGKKKKDVSALNDLQQNIIEIEDKIKYYALDIAEAIYDIDIKSWADTLSDTLVDAWANGENAAEAYKKKVNEIVRDVTKNIISQKIIQEAFKRVNLDDIITSEMDRTSGKLDEFSVKKIGDALMTASDSAISNTTKLLDYLKSVGYDLSDTADNASTLGKGIASITEDTADLLASYINAIRADVAAIRAIEERVLETGFLDVNTNLALQLTELRNISSFAERNAIAAERILDLFESVTTIGGSGRKVRV